MVIKKIKEVLGFNLPLDMICTSHGIIWREKPEQIVEQYLKWADNYQENQITIIYDTMWNGTRIMAEKIAKGIKEGDKAVNVKLFNSVAGILEEMKGLKFKNKKAAAFGCYGWSGESTKLISETLKASGFEVFDDGIKVLWNPDDENTTKCFEYGKQLAGKVNS
jgi:flavorubredoxin